MAKNRKCNYIAKWPSAEATLQRLQREHCVLRYGLKHLRVVKVVQDQYFEAADLLIRRKGRLLSNAPDGTIIDAYLEYQAKGGETHAAATLAIPGTEEFELITAVSRAHPKHDTFNRCEGRLRALDRLIDAIRERRPEWFQKIQ